MARNIRQIPFGYMMQNGKIVINPEEAAAVEEIFREYLAGKGMRAIALQMKLPYRKNMPTWNSSMVKRILENEKYIGNHGFPVLISSEVFEAATQKKNEKKAGRGVIAEEFQKIRELTFCRECGRKLIRIGGTVHTGKWKCLNPECNKFDFRLTDTTLTEIILHILNTVIETPALLNSETEAVTYSPDSEIIRQQNEIRHMTSGLYINDEHIRAELFRLAEMKYACCTYSDAPQKTEFLKNLLTDYEQLNTLDTGLLKSCVKRITVSHSAVIELEFINGIKIHQSIGKE